MTRIVKHNAAHGGRQNHRFAIIFHWFVLRWSKIRPRFRPRKAANESAAARFVDAHTISLVSVDGRSQRTITAAHTIIATGTRATRDSGVLQDRRI